MWFAFFPRRVGGIQREGIGLFKKFPIPDALLVQSPGCGSASFLVTPLGWGGSGQEPAGLWSQQGWDTQLGTTEGTRNTV